jgi:hypothetical protein
MRQAVAAFDLGEEAPGHEEALLFKDGGRKHHIFPQLVSPAVWRTTDKSGIRRRQTPQGSTNAKISHTA